ncbi:MAG TPA: HAMP domain-containing sensor histidine kinase [Pyrinomonadaceae bacterium]|nr:HAMP domain-containing sensor histidine kinase [Pyrinomonadaceae bacterium]
MSNLHAFLRKHILWVGFAAVVVPLASILVLQYYSLKELRRTSTAADQMLMKNYLNDVSKETKFFYRSQAEQVLSVSAHELQSDNLHRTKYHFGKCDAEGARRLFIAAFKENGDSEMLFFDAGDQARVVEPTAEELRAASIVAAPFRLLSREGTRVPGAPLSEDTRDPENRIIYRPVTDESARVVGIAGMILDNRYFTETFLPRLIAQTLPKFFPRAPQEKVIVTVYNPRKQLIHSTQPVAGQTDEMSTGLPYFPDYHVGIRGRHMTLEQWARYNFNYNLTLSLLMTAVLLGGIALALRTASREMKLSQMKTDFVSNVSHELRTPLSSIRVFGEFMKLGRVRDAEKMREYGEHIETESRRLTQLINNILDFSKIESGRKTYRFEPACVEELVAETVKTCEVRLRQQGFAVVYEPSNVPLPRATVDRDAVGQALMNLLDNAVKYSEEAERKEIVVRTGREGEWVKVSVQDFGVGIPREEHGKIFEKFYRVSTGLVHDVKGSGLGLSLVKHIVEAHRGRVTVESEPGRGSTFTIQLPARAGEGEREEAKGRAPSAAAPPEQPLAEGGAAFRLGVKHQGS